MLEVGNVLSHYVPRRHDVVDLYEQAEGVVNCDVLDITGGPYDLILSISTLEHVGFDEDVKDPEKPAAAVAKLRSLLAPGGELWVSFPLGYNADIDARIPRLGFDAMYFLQRVSDDNRWREIQRRQAEGARYGHPFEKGNVVAVGYARSAA